MTRRGVRVERVRRAANRWRSVAWAVGLTALPLAAHAQEESGQPTAPKPATGNPPQALSEKDYYRTIKVVQKRSIGKARRLEISPFLAYLPNDDFVRATIPGLDVTYHFTEGVALEATVAQGNHRNKQLLSEVRDAGVQPAVLDRFKVLGSFGFHWSPIYGKIAYLERKIIAYDLFFATGFGVTNTELEITTSTGSGDDATTEKVSTSFQGYYIGIGQRYYFTRNAALRIELRNYSYTQRVDASFNNRNNMLLGLGFSYLL